MELAAIMPIQSYLASNMEESSISITAALRRPPKLAIVETIYQSRVRNASNSRDVRQKAQAGFEAESADRLRDMQVSLRSTSSFSSWGARSRLLTSTQGFDVSSVMKVRVVKCADHHHDVSR